MNLDKGEQNENENENEEDEGAFAIGSSSGGGSSSSSTYASPSAPYPNPNDRAPFREDTGARTGVSQAYTYTRGDNRGDSRGSPQGSSRDRSRVAYNARGLVVLDEGEDGREVGVGDGYSSITAPHLYSREGEGDWSWNKSRFAYNDRHLASDDRERDSRRSSSRVSYNDRGLVIDAEALDVVNVDLGYSVVSDRDSERGSGSDSSNGRINTGSGSRGRDSGYTSIGSDSNSGYASSSGGSGGNCGNGGSGYGNGGSGYDNGYSGTDGDARSTAFVAAAVPREALEAMALDGDSAGDGAGDGDGDGGYREEGNNSHAAAVMAEVGWEGRENGGAMTGKYDEDDASEAGDDAAAAGAEAGGYEDQSAWRTQATKPQGKEAENFWLTSIREAGIKSSRLNNGR